MVVSKRLELEACSQIRLEERGDRLGEIRRRVKKQILHSVNVSPTFILFVFLTFHRGGLHDHGQIDETGTIRRWFTVYYMERGYRHIVGAHLYVDKTYRVSLRILLLFYFILKKQLSSATSVGHPIQK